MINKADIGSGNSSTGKKRGSYSKGRCSGCKEKKIKCDERKPACSNCVKSNKVCHYGPTVTSLDVNSSANNGSSSIGKDKGPKKNAYNNEFMTKAMNGLVHSMGVSNNPNILLDLISRRVTDTEIASNGSLEQQDVGGRISEEQYGGTGCENGLENNINKHPLVTPPSSNYTTASAESLGTRNYIRCSNIMKEQKQWAPPRSPLVTDSSIAATNKSSSNLIQTIDGPSDSFINTQTAFNSRSTNNKNSTITVVLPKSISQKNITIDLSSLKQNETVHLNITDQVLQ